MNPKVSINLCCYNSEKYLRETLGSIVNQTYKDWELIIINDGSSDSTESIIYEYIKQGYPIIYYYQENKGLGYSRNEALKRSKGEYIAFIDHDDIWCAEKLERQVSILETDPAWGAVFSDVLFFGEGRRFFRTFPRKKPSEGMIFRSLLRRYVLPMSTIVVRREVLDYIGGWFDERFNLVEDADVFLRVAFYYPIAYMDDILVKRRMHKNSWTTKKKELFPKEEEMLLEKFSKLWPSFEQEFAKEIAHMRAIIQYQYAVLDWEKGNNGAARQRMAPYLGTLKKMWVPFFFSYLPFSFYRVLKRGYKFVTTPFMGSLDDQVF